MPTEVKLPPLFAINTNLNCNTIQQVTNLSTSIDADIANFTTPKIKGAALVPKNGSYPEQILLVKTKKEIAVSFSNIIVAASLPELRTDIVDLTSHLWLKHPDLKAIDDHAENLKNISDF